MGKCRKCGKELTGIETTGWFGKLCEKCWQEQHYTQYPFKKGIDEKDKKIADLEAKLAKSDMEVFMLTKNNECFKNDIKQLKQQLAEKEKEIEELKIILSMQAVQVPEEQRLNLITTNCIQYNPNQTAIAELEKVKEIVLKEVERVEEIYTDGFQSGFNCCYVFMKEQIEQQIKSLKGEK